MRLDPTSYLERNLKLARTLNVDLPILNEVNRTLNIVFCTVTKSIISELLSALESIHTGFSNALG